MNIDETIKLLESQIAEANKLLEEIKKEKENEENKNTESVLTEYWYAINNKDHYYINSFNDILRCEANNSINEDAYSNYPTKEYAEQAQRIKEFNDKLLAFKWCYDRDFEPVFSGNYNDGAYYIYYDLEDEKYDYDWDSICDKNLIYFSSAKIVQKCCDWLNSEKK